MSLGYSLFWCALKVETSSQTYLHAIIREGRCPKKYNYLSPLQSHRAHLYRFTSLSQRSKAVKFGIKSARFQVLDKETLVAIETSQPLNKLAAFMVLHSHFKVIIKAREHSYLYLFLFLSASLSRALISYAMTFSFFLLVLHNYSYLHCAPPVFNSIKCEYISCPHPPTNPPPPRQNISIKMKCLYSKCKTRLGFVISFRA